MKNPAEPDFLSLHYFYYPGRGERIRTSDHLDPIQVRYQAALRPEGADYSRAHLFCSVIWNEYSNQARKVLSMSLNSRRNSGMAMTFTAELACASDTASGV